MIRPWINSETKKLINFRHFLFGESKKKYIPFYIYDNFKRKLAGDLRFIRKNYIKNKFAEDEKDIKKTWDNINRFVRCSNRKRDNIILMQNGDLESNDQKNAEVIKDYFASVATNLDSAIPRPRSCSFQDFLGPRNSCEFFVNISHPAEVQKIIKSFPNKGCPINEIPTHMYKSIADLLSVLISDWFNWSIRVGQFSNCQKRTRIVPVFKW